jgi:hypothetical protein
MINVNSLCMIGCQIIVTLLSYNMPEAYDKFDLDNFIFAARTELFLICVLTCSPTHVPIEWQACAVGVLMLPDYFLM